MQKLLYFTRETLNNLWQYRVRNFFSITIICLSFLIIGIFLSLSNNLQHIADQVAQNMTVVFFLDKDIEPEDTQAIEESLNQSDLVERVEYVSSIAALERFKQRFEELKTIVDDLEINPFPPSFEAVLKETSLKSEQVSEFIETILALEGVDDAQFNRDWIERMHSLSRLAQAVGFFLGGILVLASFFIISNVIKLNVFARGDEIEILRLTGATNFFIRIPFLMEGLILGLLGGLISLVLLFFLIQLFPLYLGSALGVLNEIISFRYLTLGQGIGLMLTGGIIGILGSLSALARFLKV